MKKNRIIVPALSLLVGVTLAGSISGTIAWYQYSTRANGAYLGMSGGTIGNLQLRLNGGEWLTRLTKNDIATYLAGSQEAYGSKVKPITSGNMDKNDAIPANFYRNPIAGAGEYAKWEKADTTNYISLPLELRFVENNGSGENNIAKDVYLSDLYIAADDANAANGKEDLSDAIRFHVASDDGVNQKNFLISKNGGSIATNGKLDLDGDGEIDQAYTGNKYGFGDGNQLVDVIYGEGNQVAYAAKVQDGILVGTNDENLGLNNLELDGASKSIGKTLAGSSAYLEVVITIWVEGWQEFAGSPIWDANYIDSQFDIGFEFATDID